MGACELGYLTSAFADGELRPEEARAFEAHLAGCAECAAVLADVRAISRVFAAAPRPRATPELRRRLASIPGEERERALARTAGWLTAAAAGLLVAGAAWLWAGSAESASPAPAWEIATMVGEPDAGVAEDPDVQLAAWVIGDLSARRNR